MLGFSKFLGHVTILKFWELQEHPSILVSIDKESLTDYEYDLYKVTTTFRDGKKIQKTSFMRQNLKKKFQSSKMAKFRPIFLYTISF